MSVGLVIMAAGIGSRYGGLKQLDVMGPNGETLLDFSIQDAVRENYNKIVFVIRKDFESEFRSKIGARYEEQIQIDYAFQELDTLPAGFELPEGREKPWGTGQAVLVTEGQFEGPFAVINADDFYGRQAFRVTREFFEEEHEADGKPQYALVAYQLANTLSDFGAVTRGICEVTPDEYLKNIQETEKLQRAERGIFGRALDGEEYGFTGEEPVSMNFWGFTPEIYPQLRELFQEFLKEKSGELKSEFYVPEAIGELIRRDQARVRVLHSQSSWFGVTYQEDKPRVKTKLQELVNAGEY